MGLRKFSTAAYNKLFVFAGPPAIISTHRNKLGDLTMRRSDCMALNVSYWSFFKIDDHLVSPKYSKRGVFRPLGVRLDFAGP